MSGTAAVIDRTIKFKSRKRGLSSSEMVESFLALWATGGERAEDFDHFRQDKALADLLGHELPAAQTARDFLSQFHEEDLPLLQDGKASVPSESAPLQGLAAANKELILDLQCRKPVKTATLDIDATIIHSSKRAAKRAYDGERGYQPVLVLWAEQDVIVADEFRDGNVPAGMGNTRIIEKAVAALPGKFDKIYVRGDSALYEHEAMTWMDSRAIAYAISVRMSPQIKECIEALPESHWKPAGEETDAIREWAEVNYVPTDGNWSKEFATPRRYLAIRIKPKQGELLACRLERAPLRRRDQPFRSRRRHGPRSDPLASQEGRHHRAHPRRAHERTRGLVPAEPEVRGQRSVAPHERAALQSAVCVQARRLTRGNARGTTQTAALPGPEHGRKSGPACPRDPAALRRRCRSGPGRRAPGRIPPRPAAPGKPLAGE